MKFPNDQNVDVVGRHNRPGVLNKSYYEMYFMNNGAFVDPVQISAVHVFPVPAAASSGAYLDLSAGSTTYGLVTQATEGLSAVYKWTGSGTSYTSSVAFDPSAYTGAAAQGRYIWRIGTGRYGVVLDPDASSILSGVLTGNMASSVGEYYDMWMVQMTEGSDWKTYINKFELFNDVFITFTEPPRVSARARIENPKVYQGSVVEIAVPVDISIGGFPSDQDKLNLFNGSIIDSAQVQIRKVVDGAPWVEVSGYSDTSGLVRVDSMDTIRLLVDTTTWPSITGLGTAAGVYKVRVKFTILNETHVSDELSFIIGR